MVPTPELKINKLPGLNTRQRHEQVMLWSAVYEQKKFKVRAQLNQNIVYQEKMQLYDIDVTFKYGKVMETDMKV